MTLGATHEGAESLLHAPSGMLAGLRGLGRLPREQVLARVGYACKLPLFSIPFYSLTLAGRGPTALIISPADSWPGDAEAGAAIVQGNFTLLGETVRRPGPIWAPLGVGRRWREEINSFAWLRDLRAAGGDQARRTARQLVTAWLDANSSWNSAIWDPVVIGRRLANWLGQYDFYASSADVEFRHRLLREMARQARHLARVLPAGLSGSRAISAIKGLVAAGICLPGAEFCCERGLALLRQELPRQVLGDGGHIERSPVRLLEVLRDLIDLRAMLVMAELEVPLDLQAAIEQMTPMLRLLQHGDGVLALFNDSGEQADLLVDMVLQRAGGRGRPLASAPLSGFQRLHAGRTVIIVDAGEVPPPGYDETAHAGALSFEMSVGRERLVVNCGAQPGDSDWRTIQRMTAAHSTLVVSDTNSSQIMPGGGFGRRLASVTCRRDEADGNIWLDLSHDGYEPGFGLVHHRRLFLAAGGDDLRGEDRLEGSKRVPFVIRFHLHPSVQAGLTQSGDSALLRLPRGGGWRFQAMGADLQLEPSVYLGLPGFARRTQQITLTGVSNAEGTTVKWAFRREDKPRAKR